MLTLSLSQIANICQGQLHGQDATIHSVSIDSRHIADAGIFVALRGERVDGHDYVAAAANNGAVAALVERKVDAPISQVVVASCEKALVAMACFYRQSFSGKAVFGITGSSGKTTTRSMLAAILAQSGKVSATKGNFNNDLGVPLTILAADNSADYWVIEMGAAQVGDIARLMPMVNPHVSAITNVGSAHVGRFGSVDFIAQGKSEIYRHLMTKGTAVINADDAYAAQWIKEQKGRVVSFSRENKNADIVAENIQCFADASQITLSYQGAQTALTINLPGLHNVSNALCASACALAAGVTIESVKKGLVSITAESGRLQNKTAANGARLFDDSYNANPASVKAAIAVLALQKGRKILVLGDMGELGANASSYHADVGLYAKEQQIDILLTVGKESLHACHAFGSCATHFEQKEQLARYLNDVANQSDVILIKGSRSSAMDEVVRLLEQKAIA